MKIYKLVLLIFLAFLLFTEYIVYLAKRGDLHCAGFEGKRCPLFTMCYVKDAYPDALGSCRFLSIDLSKYSKGVKLYKTGEQKGKQGEQTIPESTPVITNSTKNPGWLVYQGKTSYGDSFSIEYPKEWDSSRIISVLYLCPEKGEPFCKVSLGASGRGAPSANKSLNTPIGTFRIYLSRQPFEGNDYLSGYATLDVLNKPYIFMVGMMDMQKYPDFEETFYSVLKTIEVE